MQSFSSFITPQLVEPPMQPSAIAASAIQKSRETRLFVDRTAEARTRFGISLFLSR